jgi:hypothetical protein
LFDEDPCEIVRQLVALVRAQERLAGPELLQRLRVPEGPVTLTHLPWCLPQTARVAQRRAQAMLGVDCNAFVEPRGQRQVRQQRVRHLVRDHGFDDMEIRLRRREVTASRIDEHAA